MGEITTISNGVYRRIRFNQPGGTLRSDVTYNVPSTFRHVESRPDLSRTRKPKGWKFPKAYTLKLDVVGLHFGTLYGYDTQGRLTDIWQGYIPGTLGVTGHDAYLPLDGLRERAIMGCFSKLKNTKVNLAVAAGEAAEVARMINPSGRAIVKPSDALNEVNRGLNKIGDGLAQLAKAVKAAKKGRLRDAARHLGVRSPRQVATSTPEKWLAYQYGLSPLLKDIHGTYSQLTKAEGDGDNKTVGITCGAFVKSYERFYPAVGAIREEVVVAKRSGVFVRLDYEPSNTFLSTLSSVGMTNPASVAWELLPWSFVLDWALPIGDYLDSLDAESGWTFKSGSISVLQKMDLDQRYSGSPTGTRHGDYRRKMKRLGFTREVLFDSPGTPLPSWKNPWSTGHAANGMSLLTSVVKK